jgi:hypothetical protein
LLFDAGLIETKRKVDAVQSFVKGAEATPTPSILPGLTMQDRQALYRALMQGVGFFDWMTTLAVPNGATGRPAQRKLPSINFIDVVDKEYIASVMDGVAHYDRSRLLGYLRDRPLGLGLITAVS